MNTLDLKKKLDVLSKLTLESPTSGPELSHTDLNPIIKVTVQVCCENIPQSSDISPLKISAKSCKNVPISEDMYT